MATKGVTSILAGYFNEGTGMSLDGTVPAKRPLKTFQGELKELTTEEKYELALGVCEITGDTITKEAAK